LFCHSYFGIWAEFLETQIFGVDYFMRWRIHNKVFRNYLFCDQSVLKSDLFLNKKLNVRTDQKD
jgi:hypothetical protein